jgi:sigma-B regulation protein RsbU (phosphoserine phosphatase)
MIDLGAIVLGRSQSIPFIRKKVFRVVQELDRDGILATRVGTAVSEMARLLGRTGTNPRLELGLQHAGGHVELVLSFTDTTELPSPSSLSAFFTRISAQHRENAGYSLEAICRVSNDARIDEGHVDRLRAIVTEQSRDELLSALQSKNRQLQESLENLRRTTSAKDRMESELNIGQEIQMSLLPLQFPPYPDRHEFSIFAKLVPAREVGGDFYDFFLIDRDHLCICIGDVSGKGVPSALFAAVTKTLIKSLAKSGLSPAEVLTQSNGELAENNESNMFVTVFLSVLDVSTGALTYSNAGHNPPYLYSRSGNIERLAQRHGPVVGAMEGCAYDQSIVSLAPGDLLLTYTDGVTEATSRSYELFKESRLVQLLQTGTINSVNTAVDVCLAAVREFESGAEQADDITLLVAQFFGRGTGETALKLELRLKNDVAELPRVQNECESYLTARGIPTKIIRRLLIAFDELLSNIISYAYRTPGEHDIELTLEHDTDQLRILLQDDGIPFNPLAQRPPDTDASVDDREIGGLGIHLVRNMLDEVQYERRGDQNVLMLVARVNPAPD